MSFPRGSWAAGERVLEIREEMVRSGTPQETTVPDGKMKTSPASGWDSGLVPKLSNNGISTWMT